MRDVRLGPCPDSTRGLSVCQVLAQGIVIVSPYTILAGQYAEVSTAQYPSTEYRFWVREEWIPRDLVAHLREFSPELPWKEPELHAALNTSMILEQRAPDSVANDIATPAQREASPL